MRSTHCLIVNLYIEAQELLHYYRGNVNQVLATAENGITVQFPVNVLRKFVTRHGVQGKFRIFFDENNKFIEIERVD
ncbi:MAG: DUF2835 domain-containing protein [Legionellales bacterium]|nr:DUF2835 domain-containing protein [Legionellales bacterium]